jgi:uncharacterized membrane protein YcfT
MAPGIYTKISNIMTPIRMPLFFSVSGFLAASAMRAPWPDFLRKKIWTFVWLFAVWSTARWLYFRYVQTNGLVPDEGSDPYQLLEMWWAPNTGIWFIWALAIFMTATKLLSSAPRLPVIAAATVLSVLTFGGHLPVDLFTHRNVLQYFVFFLFGCWYGKTFAITLTERPLPFAIGGFLAFILLILFRSKLQTLELGTWAFISSVAGLSWLCGTAVLMSRFGALRDTFSYFGRNTLPVYVTHVMLVSGIAGLLALATGPDVAIGYIAAPLMVFTAIAVSLGIKAAADRSGAGWLYTPPMRRERVVATA